MSFNRILQLSNNNVGLLSGGSISKAVPFNWAASAQLPFISSAQISYSSSNPVTVDYPPRTAYYPPSTSTHTLFVIASETRRIVFKWRYSNYVSPAFYAGSLLFDVYNGDTLILSDTTLSTLNWVLGASYETAQRYNVAAYCKITDQSIYQTSDSRITILLGCKSNISATNPHYLRALSIDVEGLNAYMGGNVVIYASEEFGRESEEGGYTGGTFDDSSDVISIPPVPTMGVTSAGFINVYSPTQGELVQFGSELFPDLSFTPVSQGGAPASVTDALVAMAQVLVDFGNQIPQLIDMYINANLINYVIDCHILPVAPTTAGNAPLKVGFKTFSQSPLKVSSDYVDFDCGSLNVGEYYANFADYSPYTSAKLYLPFVGFMDIAPEYWQSGTLSVTYRFNVIDGSFVAYVKSTSSKSKLSDTVIAQFGGNACVHIPITGLNYASMVSGIVSAVSPLLPSSKSGAGTADTLVNSANTIASAKPTMQQSNGYNATTSFLTVRVPYLLIERSVSNFSRNFAEENGIPSNITMSFAGLTGFTKATMLHLDGIAGATDDDLNEIAQLLSEGVIL